MAFKEKLQAFVDSGGDRNEPTSFDFCILVEYLEAESKEDHEEIDNILESCWELGIAFDLLERWKASGRGSVELAKKCLIDWPDETVVSSPRQKVPCSSAHCRSCVRLRKMKEQLWNRPSLKERHSLPPLQQRR